jgi:predicted anti-sigma-YlaC factor YlaD
MVTGTHPTDIELFDYVECEVTDDRKAELEAHLATCAECGEHVARVTAGRDALRAAQFLQLPPRRREAIFLNLPEQRRAAGRSPAMSPKRLLAVLTPIAAVGAVVAALVTTGNQGGGGGAAGGTAGGARAALGTQTKESTQMDQSAEGYGTLLVAGSPDQVAAELRQKGFDARAVGKRVEVRNATRAEVTRALANRSTGRVRIVIVK